ncbi:MAG: hypothetical protein ACRDQ9_20830, partial [Pseudonocardiaceae bacterium]
IYTSNVRNVYKIVFPAASFTSQSVIIVTPVGGNANQRVTAVSDISLPGSGWEEDVTLQGAGGFNFIASQAHDLSLGKFAENRGGDDAGIFVK